MTDPHDSKQQPTGDEQFSSSPNEQNEIEELDVRSEDADKVKGGRREDPCAGGEIAKK